MTSNTFLNQGSAIGIPNGNTDASLSQPIDISYQRSGSVFGNNIHPQHHSTLLQPSNTTQHGHNNSNTHQHQNLLQHLSGNVSNSININNQRNFRRESIAHSQGVGGISWGSLTIGSWLKDEVMYNNMNNYTNNQNNNNNNNSNSNNNNHAHTSLSPPIQSSYLPDLEANYCKDYSCCGQLLPTLHDLLKHYEESHISPSPPALQPKPLQNFDTVSTTDVFINSNNNNNANHNNNNNQRQQLGQRSVNFGFNQSPFQHPQSHSQARSQQTQSQQQSQSQHHSHQTQQQNSQSSHLQNPLSQYQDVQQHSNPQIQAQQHDESHLQPTSQQNIHEQLRNQFSSTSGSSNPLQQRPQSSSQFQFGQIPGNNNINLNNSQFSDIHSSRGSQNNQESQHSTPFPMSLSNDDSAMDLDEEMEDGFIDDPSRNLYVAQGSEKPFTCPVIGCNKNYKNQNGLKYHRLHGHQNQKLHLNPDGTYSVIDPNDGNGSEQDKPYRCEVCGKRYKNLNGLKYHRGHSTH